MPKRIRGFRWDRASRSSQLRRAAILIQRKNYARRHIMGNTHSPILDEYERLVATSPSELEETYSRVWRKVQPLWLQIRGQRTGDPQAETALKNALSEILTAYVCCMCFPYRDPVWGVRRQQMRKTGTSHTAV